MLMFCLKHVDVFQKRVDVFFANHKVPQKSNKDFWGTAHYDIALM